MRILCQQRRRSGKVLVMFAMLVWGLLASPRSSSTSASCAQRNGR